MKWLSCIALLTTLMLCSCAMPDQQAQKRQAESHLLLGMSLLQENNPSKALSELYKAEQLDPGNPMVHAALAQAYLAKQAYPQAEQHFRKAYELSNQQPSYMNNLGAVYLTMERFDDAIAAFQVVAGDLTFDRPEIAWAGMGYAYFNKKDYAAAERAYKRARELNTRYYEAHFRLGELYYVQDRGAEAVAAFDKAVAVAPRSSNGQYWLGLASMKMRDNDRAIAAFREVVRLAPSSEQADLARNYLKILKK